MKILAIIQLMLYRNIVIYSLFKSIKLPLSPITPAGTRIHRIQGAFVAVILRNMGDMPRAATSSSYPQRPPNRGKNAPNMA